MLLIQFFDEIPLNIPIYHSLVKSFNSFMALGLKLRAARNQEKLEIESSHKQNAKLT
jgi:hypothetical protein